MNTTSIQTNNPKLNISVIEEAKNKIQAIEEELFNLEPVELIPTHLFADGLYIRQVTVPEGTLLTTKIHKKENVLFVLKGKCLVYANDGSSVEITAPYITVTKPGTKRAIYALEETLFMTAHATTETTVEGVEAALSTNDYKEFTS